jgi:DNA-binding SARP family transcriptional activator/Tol biopolymer transport system component
MPIELRVLGGRDLISPDGRTVHALLVQPKRFALLVYLLLDRPFRVHARDELLALFWPEYQEDKARNALSQALTFIRRALGDAAIMTRGSDEVAVDRALFTCDALTFEVAAARGDDAVALAVYLRDLLDGFHVDDAPEFSRWLEAQRAHFRSRAVSCAHALVTRSRETGNYQHALTWAERGAALAPHDEVMATQVILLHDRLGHRAEALRAYTEYSARVAADLHLEPSADLVVLVDRIRKGAGSSGLIASPAPDAGPSVPRSISTGSARREVPISPPRFPASLRVGTLWTATILLGIAAAAVTWTWLRHRAPPVSGARFVLSLDDSVRPRSEESGVTIALSPDGSQFVYLGGTGTPHLYLRTLDDLVPRPLAGTEGASNPQFSPDGRWLAFVASGHLMKMPVSGGPIVTLGDSVFRYTWGDRDLIVFGRTSGGLWRMGAAGGAAEPLTQLDTARGETRHTWPSLLPGAKASLFAIVSREPGSAELAAVRLSDRRVVRLGVQGNNPRYVQSGHIVFGRLDGSVFAVPFDAQRLQVTGLAVPALESVVVKSGGATEVAVARNGTLVYVPVQAARQLVLVDRRGASQALRPELLSYSGPRFSPDGKRLAVAIGDVRHTDVWIYEVALGTRSRLTDDGKSSQPSWTPDGRRVAWSVGDSASDHIEWRPWDGRGAAETLLADADGGVIAPTGRFLVATSTNHATNAHRVSLVSLDAARRRTYLSPGNLIQAKVSPDGRWLAYARGRGTHGREVYVQAIPGPGTARQISIAGGTEPVWSPSGRELFFRSNGKIISATISAAPEFAVVRRDTLFDDVFWSTPDNNWFADYDVSPDGRHFVFVKSSGASALPIVIFGWSDQLHSRMAPESRN